MRLAILSDIHANLTALEACLRDAERHGAEQYIFLGDIVGYGPDPGGVVAVVRALTQEGAAAILGNHDEAAFSHSENMNPTAAAAIRWTREHLSQADKDWLSQLPLQHSMPGLVFVHADAAEPSRWRYVTDAETARPSLAAHPGKVTFCGHVHVPALYCNSSGAKVISHHPVTGTAIPLSAHRTWLAVAGSVGQPRDHNPAAAYCMFDTATRELVYRRVAYDVESVANRVHAAGLPGKLAARLLLGS